MHAAIIAARTDVAADQAATRIAAHAPTMTAERAAETRRRRARTGAASTRAPASSCRVRRSDIVSRRTLPRSPAGTSRNRGGKRVSAPTPPAGSSASIAPSSKSPVAAGAARRSTTPPGRGARRRRARREQAACLLIGRRGGWAVPRRDCPYGDGGLFRALPVSLRSHAPHFAGRDSPLSGQRLLRQHASSCGRPQVWAPPQSTRTTGSSPTTQASWPGSERR